MRSIIFFVFVFFSSQAFAQVDTVKCGDYIAYGNLKNGLRAGVWAYESTYYRGQICFTGKYKKGRKTGLWKFYLPYDEFPTVVHYKNNVPHGPIVSYNYAGEIYMQGQFVKGKKDGKWVFYSEKKETTVHYYKDGQPTGTWKEGNSSGQVSVYGREGYWPEKKGDSIIGGGYYQQGKRTGRWKENYPYSGTFEGEYKDGKQHGRWTQVKNGITIRITYYEDGLKHGADSLWKENSILEYVYNYHHDTLFGIYQEFYPNKRLACTGMLLNNQHYLDQERCRESYHRIPMSVFMVLDLVENGICSFHDIETSDDGEYSPAYRDSIISLLKKYNPSTDTCPDEYISSEVRTGYWKYFYPNGNVKEEGVYLPFVEDSIWWDTIKIEVPDNPKVYFPAWIKNAKPIYCKTGWWKIYNEKGEMIREERYDENGVLTETRKP